MEVFNCRGNGLKEIFKVLTLESGEQEVNLVFGVDSSVNIVKPASYAVGGTLKLLNEDDIKNLGATSGVYSSLAVTMLVCKFRGVWRDGNFLSTKCDFYSPIKLDSEKLQDTSVSGVPYQGDICIPIIKDIGKRVTETLNKAFAEGVSRKTFLRYRLYQ